MRSKAVEQAEAVREATDDTTAREALAELLEAYKRLRRDYVYLYHQGEEPEPDPVQHPGSHGLPEPDALEALPGRWRDEAETLREHGAEAQAASLERCADDLEAAEAARQLDAVTLEEAEEIGGYSYSHLQHLVADGTIPNVGHSGAPRIRRCDVPRKPGHGSDRPGPSSSRKEWLAEAVEAG